MSQNAPCDAEQSTTSGEKEADDPASDTLHGQLFDADGLDRNVAVEGSIRNQLQDHHLLWISLLEPDNSEIVRLAEALDLPDSLRSELTADDTRPRLHRYPDCIHLVIQMLERADDKTLERHSLSLVAGERFVVTIADAELSPVADFVDGLKGDTRLGGLGSAGFVAAIIDSMFNTYLHHIEAVERRIDALDLLALGAGDEDKFLAAFVDLRKQIAQIRRALVPHRAAFAPLARPDFALHDELGEPGPGLVDRLERVIDAVENARELLLGSFDIYLGRVSQRTNNVVKALTLLSAILLPAVVVAGVMGMNFDMSFFKQPSNFWVVVGAMIVLASGTLTFAKIRHWI